MGTSLTTNTNGTLNDTKLELNKIKTTYQNKFQYKKKYLTELESIAWR